MQVHAASKLRIYAMARPHMHAYCLCMRFMCCYMIVWPYWAAQVRQALCAWHCNVRRVMCSDCASPVRKPFRPPHSSATWSMATYHQYIPHLDSCMINPQHHGWLIATVPCKCLLKRSTTHTIASAFNGIAV